MTPEVEVLIPHAEPPREPSPVSVGLAAWRWWQWDEFGSGARLQIGWVVFSLRWPRVTLFEGE